MLVWALSAVPALVQGVAIAQTATWDVPEGIWEGGRVAQQAGKKSDDNPTGCPERSNAGITFGGNRGSISQVDGQTIGGTQGSAEWYQNLIRLLSNRTTDTSSDYCEYRDNPDTSNRSRRKTGSLMVNASWNKLDCTLLNNAARYTVEVGGQTLGQYAFYAFDVPAYGTKRLVLFFTSTIAPNWTLNDGEPGEDMILTCQGGLSSTQSPLIAVLDDDDIGYVGRRREHPYGRSWRGSPHCYTEANCAYD